MILIWAFSYLFTIFWSADIEFAWLGFLKYLTVPIFLILMIQYNFTSGQQDKCFDKVAKIAAIMIVVILIVSFFEKIITGEINIFFYNNRLAGFFGYANSLNYLKLRI